MCWDNQRWSNDCCRDGPDLPKYAGHKKALNAVVSLADNDDNDHSLSHLSVHKALTCPEGQSARAVSLAGTK